MYDKISHFNACYNANTQIHGTNEGTVSYDGSAPAGWRSAKGGVKFFRELNGAADAEQVAFSI